MTIKFTEDHEWVRTEDGLAVVGITDFAQQQLGEVVYVELPEVGSALSAGEEAAVVESVKAAGEVKSPIDGSVTEVNSDLTDNPEKVNEQPLSEGWIFKIKPEDDSQLSALMDEKAYHTMIESIS